MPTPAPVPSTTTPALLLNHPPTTAPTPAPTTAPNHLTAGAVEEAEVLAAASWIINGSRRELLTDPSESCFEFVLIDNYGDGWNGAEYSVREANTIIVGAVVASGTLDDGNFTATHDVCLADGCYALRVTSGDYNSEISWTFGTLSGGAPWARRYFSIVNGIMEGPFASGCPTLAPTVSNQPSFAPTSTQVPSVTPAPTPLPTPVPTPGPTAPPRFVARTWTELRDGLQVERAEVNVTADIDFDDGFISVENGQYVTAFCNRTDHVGPYCATLDGLGWTLIFYVKGTNSHLRLIGLQITGGYGDVSERNQACLNLSTSCDALYGCLFVGRRTLSGTAALAAGTLW